MSFVNPIRRIRRRPALLFSILLIPFAVMWVCGSACDDDKKVTPPEVSDYLDQSSAVNVLENLKTAYVKREYAQYEKLFSADFIFVFNPADVDDPINPTPQQWARADEMDATRNLLTHDHVEGISLNWSPGQLTADDTYGWKIRVDDVLLDVQTRNELGEVWILQVKGATHRFYFREESNLTPAGRKKWVCTRWEDSPIGLARSGGSAVRPETEETSWGAIKGLYR